MHPGFRLLPCLLVLAGCAQTPDVSGSGTSSGSVRAKTITLDNSQDILQCGSGGAVGHTIKYIPQPEVPVFNYSIVSLDNKNQIVLDHEEFDTDDGEATNELLPNISTEVAVEELNGAINVAGFFSGSAERRKIIIDFMKYRTEPVLVSDTTNGVEIAYYSRVGVGLRVEIDISTVDAQASLGSLVAIAASAQAGRSAGTISTRIIGMESEQITALAPFTSDLSEGSIQQVLNGLASVRAKLHEDDTKVHPHFLARLACVPVGD